MMKRCLSLLLILLLLLPAGGAALAEGEEQSAVEISDLAGLKAIADDPEGSYVLTADIDMSGEDWTPIPFYGTLDGSGHTLYNLRVHTVGAETRNTYDGNDKRYETVFAGLFSVMERASVRDLRLVGADLDIESGQHCFVGLLAGYIYRCNLQGCTVQGRARLVNYAVMTGIGGLVGYGTGNDIGYCRADVELVFEDRNFDARCEQFMGGIMSCGLVNIENCTVNIQGYDSCHGFVHNGGLVGMYYYCCSDVHAQSVRNNEINGQISFFEDNTNRRAYCSPTLGEEMSVPGNYYNNEGDFTGNESFDYSLVLQPETCAEPDYELTVTPPGCGSWGYTQHSCRGCGYTWVDSYTPPQHTPGDWEYLRIATADREGWRERHCTVCDELIESESYAYIPPEDPVSNEAAPAATPAPAPAAQEPREIITERDVTITTTGIESTEGLGVVYRGSARAATAKEAAELELSWSSDDPGIATVSKNGTIHGIRQGQTTVRYRSADGLYTGVCYVTVYYSFWQWLLIIFCFGWLWYI